MAAPRPLRRAIQHRVPRHRRDGGLHPDAGHRHVRALPAAQVRGAGGRVELDRGLAGSARSQAPHHEAPDTHPHGAERVLLPAVPDLGRPGRNGHRADGRAPRGRLLHLGLRLSAHRRLLRRRPRDQGAAGAAARGGAAQGARSECPALLSAECVMDFALHPEHEELVRTLNQFARKELAPRSRDWDRTGEFPAEAWRRMGDLGLLGLRAPAAYGGQEADLLTVGLAMEAIARGDFSCTYGIQLAALAGQIIGAAGADDVKRRWLPPTVRGETVIALALTEPGVGSDAANLACRAVREGEHYVLTGEKSGISLGMAARASIVFARTSPERARGITAFLVDLSLPGVSRSRLRDMGSHAIQRAVLSFDGVRVPVSHRLGEEGTGFYQVMRGFDGNRVCIGLACLGIAQESLEDTMRYVRERRAFGRPP